MNVLRSIKTLFFIMVFAICSVVTVNAYDNNEVTSENNPISIEEFNRLKSEGVYGEDVTYENLINSLKDEFVLNDKTEVDSKAAYSPKAGDIVITSSTSSSGITGHAGIFIDGTSILHIQGPGHKPSTLTWTQWKSKYPKTWVYRTTKSNVNQKAADWARINYKDKAYTYQINTKWGDKNPTYCSKIVWQAYYFGTGNLPVMKSPGRAFIVAPYSLPNYFNSAYAPTKVYDNR